MMVSFALGNGVFRNAHANYFSRSVDAVSHFLKGHKKTAS
jgi:hypothetical protein